MLSCNKYSGNSCLLFYIVLWLYEALGILVIYSVTAFLSSFIYLKTSIELVSHDRVIQTAVR